MPRSPVSRAARASTRLFHPALSIAMLLGAAACAPQAPADAPHAAPSASPPPLASAAPIADDAAPLGRLPADVRPTACTLDLSVDPKASRFSGVADIEIALAAPRSVLWLHGKHLAVKSATVTVDGEKAPLTATWTDAHESGVAKLTLPRAVGPGRAKLHIEYDAPFAEGLQGLHKSPEAGIAYAFTQFESISAREAFPSFDEPGFKIPFTVALTISKDDKAVANTHEVSRANTADGRVRVQFAPTEPLPSYLVAFAVGPFDIVDVAAIPPNAVRKRPLPLRGVAVKGRGKDMAYALAHTGEILAKLEGYVGVEYPYDKLDIIAVPEKDGAMENPGAVTFVEWLVMMDEKTAPARQKRAYASVMAHELAHQWFGDLVTTAWWDDIWLNEAFATWFAARTVDAWDPASKGDLDLLASAQYAMETDALVSARRIRQPIESTHDIANAFDSITYTKGGGVIRMFEGFIGPEAFQKGIHAYLEKHRFGAATADDLLAALGAAAGKDVATPFRTFLDQPGVPYVDVALTCGAKGGTKPQSASVTLRQSRFFPKGSTGEAPAAGAREPLWSIPLCVRYETRGEKKDVCTELKTREAEVQLPLVDDACPTWIFPNADATGYFRFGMAPAEVEKLRTAGLAKLTTREKMAFTNSLRTGYAKGTIPFKAALATTAPLAREEMPGLALEASEYIRGAREWFEGDAALAARIETYGRTLYKPVIAPLGWAESPKETAETSLRRADGLRFLAFTARDPAVRAEAARRGRAYGLAKDKKFHPEAVSLNELPIALGVVGEDADAATFDALYALLGQTEDQQIRNTILGALGRAQKPELAKRARELAFDPKLRATEFLSPMYTQLAYPKLREDAWAFVKTNYDKLAERLGEQRTGRLVYAASSFCDEPHAKDVEAFFAPRVAKMPGAPRVLASVTEGIRLCVVKRSAQEASAREAFGATPAKTPAKP